VTGVEREAELVRTVLARCPSARSILSADLLSYAALIERAALVICNNTLPLHLADAVRTPLLVLYSGTDYEEQWRPRASRAILLRRPTPCHPCYLFDCPIGQPCLDVPSDELAVAAEQLLTSTEVAVGGVS
jgi:ADP-heptose:LPS heptosyltransferase